METTVERQPTLLRHTLATLAYRADKAVRDAPAGFEAFRIGETTRTPAEILAHMGDLMDWAVWLARAEHRWQDAQPLPWTQEIGRFFAAVERLDALLASGERLGGSIERVFQGPIADALTHVGQITLLRRLAGAPVRGENYAKAEIRAGRVGTDQSDVRVEFD